ncbi:MAG: orotate phosphoribosyltransferase [Chloroflexi bacterium]|nr:orotate phosphoribosyltransferase [Chloroflexota bacterium]MBT4073623.1 orotate phosphoribosyltransferase [Chloroflexota bacterium]MBT5318483.1 orotate phosphoribosyltransferase [Chloroflexota bacterium]MBT6682641.1 orotate phosphoribosyltransferase [Chloroflexota bacterium]
MADLKKLATRTLERAQELDALRFGDFTLTSGAKSSYYFDGRVLTLDPEGADLVSEAFLAMAVEAGAAGVGGPTVAAVPIAGALALRSHQAGTPMDGYFVRDAVKEHGARKQVEGAIKPGTKVVVFDDTVSTGGSLLIAMDAIQEFGCEVVAVLCVLDRHQGGSDEVRRRGVRFRAMLEADPEGNVAISDGL